MKQIALSFILLAASALAAQEPTYDLVWKPRANDLLDYKLNLQIAVEDYHFVYNSDLRLVVKSVADNGDYEVETTTRNSKIKFQDEDEMSPDEPDPIVEKYDSKGKKISVDKPDATDDDTDANPVGKILSEVTSFSPPEGAVKKGDKWSRDIEADPKSKTEQAKADYEVVGEEKAEGYDVVRIDYKYRGVGVPKPVEADGSFRLKRSDFSIVTFEASVDNFKMDDNAPLGTAKLSLKRW